MRNLPVQCGTIRITSVAGELRYAGVSGPAKTRLLWLFRHFSILDFPVLDKKQQQLIAQTWQAGATANANAEDSPQDLIGAIDGFVPPLIQVPVPDQPPVLASSATHYPRNLRLSRVLFGIAALTAMVILLLGVGIVRGPKRDWRTPQPRVEAAAPPDHVSPPVPSLVKTSSEPTSARISAQPAPSAASFAQEPAKVYAAARPGAMAEDASPAIAKPPRVLAATSSRSPGKSEVMIRVSVDSAGRAQSFQILSGDRTKTSAALNAAKHWSFQPCSASAECEHTLRFTEYGDASGVKMVD